MGLRRLSQAVVPVSPGDADPNRYVYLTPENAEPSLGLPDGNGFILFSNTDGSRSFTEIGNLLIEGGGILIDANGRISVDPNILVNVNISANVDVTRTGFTRFDYLSPNGQVLLTGTDVYGNDLELSSNDQVLVYINGFLLQPNVDYTYANGYNDANVESAVLLDIPISRENSTVSIHRYSPTLFAQGPDGNATFSGTSDDIPEGPTNLFFTNARARAAFSASDSIDYDEANGIFSANIEYANGLIEAFIDDNTTTDNIAEGTNLYFTNTRAVDAVIDNISTSNVAEGANLYFTNARAVGSLTGGSGVVIEANGLIIADSATAFSGNTDAVPEGTANLYYTDERVYANVTNADVQLGNLTVNGELAYDWTDADITGANLVSTESLQANSFSANTLSAFVWNNLYTTNVIEGANLYYTNARVASFISSNITTSNITEGANLYFTNTRAVGSLTAGDNIVIEANGLIVATATLGGAIPTLYTSNIVEDGDVVTGNVYFTQARARAAINAGFGLAYDNTTGTVYVEDGAITTSNVAEGANLYFTNTRAVGSLTAGDNIVIESNGLIISSATLSSLPTLYTSNIVEDGNTTTGNVYFSNTRARGAFTFGPGLTFNSTTGSLQANVRSVNGLTGIVVLNTANIVESGNTTSGNVYFTNARARAAFTAGAGIDTANLANGVISTTAIVDEPTVANVLGGIDDVVLGNLIPSVPGQRDIGNLTHPWRDVWITFSSMKFVPPRPPGSTAPANASAIISVDPATNKLQFTDASGNTAFTTTEISEGANLYFTNARVNAAVTAFITTSNVREGSNLYFSNTRARRAFTAGAGVNAANLALGIITVDSAGGQLSGFIDASNVIETGSTTTGNVFFTNARARAAFTAGAGVNAANLANGIVQADVRSVAGKTGVVVLYTPNVIEAGNTTTGNVYFSNARARQAFAAGTGIVGADLANGIITVSGSVGGSSFNESNILAGSGISITRAGGNATIDNTGILDVRADPAFVANGIIVTNDGSGNILLRLNPTISLSETINANNIVANVITFTRLNGFINASNIVETGSPTTGNVFFSNARARRAFTAGAGINASNLALGVISTDFAQLDLTTTDTDALPEGTANLYFTNARARAAVANLDISIFTNDAGYLTATDPVVIDPADVFVEMEAVNTGLGHGNIAFNPVTGTISFDKVTNANVRSAFSAGSGIAITDGVISLTGSAAALFDGNTDALSEGVNNLYYSNDRVSAYLADFGLDDLTVVNITVLGEIITNNQGGDITNVNLFSSIAVAANEWYGIDTSDVPESGNLYFSNARARSAVVGLDISAFVNDRDYVTNANVRTYFGASGQGLEYNNTTGIFSLDTAFVEGVAAAISTDVQNFELANAAVAGDVMIINDDGTVDPIREIVTQTDLRGSEIDPAALMYLFPAAGATRQYYGYDVIAQPNYRLQKKSAVSTFGRDNILVTMAVFHNAEANSPSDYGIVVKAVKLTQDGKSLEQVGTEYLPVATGDVGATMSFMTKMHILYDDSSNLLGYERYFLFYYIGTESSKRNVMESVIVDKSTLTITRQNLTELPSTSSSPTYNSWPNLTIPTDENTNYTFDISSVKQDPHTPSRIWFGGLRLSTSANAGAEGFGEDHTYVGYFDIASDGSISNIFGKSLENIHVFNPQYTNPSDNVETYYKEVRLALDPNNANKLVVLLSGNLGASFSGTVTYDYHRTALYYLELTSNNFTMLSNRSTVLSDIGATDDVGFAHDIVWHPLRNNIYALIGYKLLTFKISSSTGLLDNTQVHTMNQNGWSQAITTAPVGFFSSTLSILYSGWIVNPGKIYYSTQEEYKNNLILVVPTGSPASSSGTRGIAITLDPETGNYQDSTERTTFNQFSKLQAENPTVNVSASNGSGGQRACTIGFNPYSDDGKFYTAQFHVATALTTYTQSMGYLTWGTMGGLTSNWDKTKFVGILQESGNTGQVKPIATIGTTSLIHSALNPSDEIYVDVYDGTLSNVETDSNFKIGSALSESNVLIYNRKLGERTGELAITGFRNIGTGAGSIAYDPYSGLVTYNKVDIESVVGNNPIQVESGVIELKIGDNLTVNAGGYLAGVESFTSQDAIDAVLPEILTVNNLTGHGHISKQSGTGTITYNRVTSANIRSEFSAGGGLVYNSGVYAVKVGDKLAVNATGHLNATTASGTEVYQSFSADNAGTGYGSLTYNSATGEFTFNRVTQANVVAAVNTNVRINSLGVGTAASGTAGEIRATNDITAYYSSDERLKTNINVIENALEKVNNIRGVTFDWNDTALEMYPDRTDTDVGVIAQEIEKVLPEVVVDRDNGFKAVRYEKIIPLLIEAIKDLKQEIEELKKNG